MADEFPNAEELPEEPISPEDISPFDGDGAAFDDINEFARAEWKESTTADERIRTVIKRTVTAKTANEIADVAAVSESKARTALKALAEEGVASARHTDSGTVYQRDPDRHLIEQIHQLATAGDVVEQIQDLKAEIAEYREAYDTESPEELLVSDRKLSEQELTDVSHWRTAMRDFEYLRAAYRIQQAKRRTPAADEFEGASDELRVQ